MDSNTINVLIGSITSVIMNLIAMFIVFIKQNKKHTTSETSIKALEKHISNLENTIEKTFVRKDICQVSHKSLEATLEKIEKAIDKLNDRIELLLAKRGE